MNEDIKSISRKKHFLTVGQGLALHKLQSKWNNIKVVIDVDVLS